MKPRHLLLIACMLFGVLQANAVTSAGGNITYKAIDSVTYEVTVKQYVDCNGIALTGDSLRVSWSGGSFTQKLTLIKSKDITGSFQGCGITSRCAGSFQYGFQEREYKTTVDISNTACEVLFEFNGKLRSSAITTGAAGTNTYLYAKLNKCFGLNNSAHTSFSPQILIPVGNDASLSTGYIDSIDNDSLAFELVSPESASGVQVSYSGSWSAAKPITFLGFPNSSLSSPAGFHFDKQTGQLTFRPTRQGEVTVIVIRVHEYRKINGKMEEVGVTEIDQTVVVVNSTSNKTPKITATFLSEVCAGKEAKIFIETRDDDKNDSTFLEWDNRISGASLTLDTPKRLASATFRWTPTQADVRNQPYTFTVRVRDNGCSPNGTNTRTISITVREKTDTKYLQIASKQNSCNRLKLVMATPAQSNVARGYIVTDAYIRSSTKDEAEIYFDNAGWNKFAVWAQEGVNCPDTAWDSTFVTLPYTLQVSHTPDSMVCPNQTTNIIAQTINGKPPYIYRWATGNFINPSAIYNYTATNKYAFFDLKVIDSLGCYFHDSVKINTHSLQAAKFLTPDTICKNASPFVLKALPIGGKWTGFGVVNDSVFRSDTLSQSGKIIVTYSFTDSNSCPSLGQTPIQVLPVPVLQFSAAPTQGVSPLKVDFFGLSFPAGNNWMWYFTNIITNKTDSISGQLPTYTFTDSGEYNVTLKADTAGCVSTLTKNKFIRVGDTTQSGGGGNVWVRDINNYKVKIYPNPAKDKLTIETDNVLAKVVLVDVLGRRYTIERNINATKAEIDIQHLSAGIYVIEAKDIEGNMYTSKVQISR